MLNQYKIPYQQIDLGLEIVLTIFSAGGLRKIFNAIETSPYISDKYVNFFFQRKNQYIKTIDAIINFLQGKNDAFAYRIVRRDYLPESERFKLLDNIFIDENNIIDYARILSSLYLDDLVDFFNQTILPEFYLSRYQEKLVKSYNFNEIYQKVSQTDLIIELMEQYLIGYDFSQVNIVAITIPFPGNLYSSLKMGQWIKKNYPKIKIVFGGGYINTELRMLKEKRIFEFTDFITLDNGEVPLLQIIDYVNQNTDNNTLVRTFILENDEVIFYNNINVMRIEPEIPFIPDYRTLPLDRYLSMIEMINPMHRLWSEKGFLKLRLAEGCYYHKCTFCDTDIDYIRCYKPLPVSLIIQQIHSIIEQTGCTNFHFVDEAMPPSKLKELALEIIREKLQINYWGNIRFDKTFSYDLCRLLKRSGLIAVTGGLESADNRLLKMINKGFNIEQAIEICHNFSRAEVMVHCYMIYGLPTETVNDLANSLEIIRQMFLNRIIESVYYHRFSLTIHSKIYQHYPDYQINWVNDRMNDFANNDLEYLDENTELFDKIAFRIEKAIYNFNYKNYLTKSIGYWLNNKKIHYMNENDYVKNLIKYNLLKNKQMFMGKICYWVNDQPFTYTLEGEMVLVISDNQTDFEYAVPKALAQWIIQMCYEISVYTGNKKRLIDFRSSFPETKDEHFENFLHNELFNDLRKTGLWFI